MDTLQKVQKLINTEEVIDIEILETYDGDDTYEVLSKRFKNKDKFQSLMSFLGLNLDSYPHILQYMDNGEVIDLDGYNMWRFKDKYKDTIGECFDAVIHKSEWYTHSWNVLNLDKDDIKPDYKISTYGLGDRGILFRDGEVYKGTFTRTIATLNNRYKSKKKTVFTISLKADFLTADKYNDDEYREAFKNHLKTEYYKVYNSFKDDVLKRVDINKLNIEDVLNQADKKEYFSISLDYKEVSNIKIPKNIGDNCLLMFQIDDTKDMFSKRGMLQLFFTPDAERDITEPIETPNCERVENLYSFHFTELENVKNMSTKQLDTAYEVSFGTIKKAKDIDYICNFDLSTQVLADFLSINDYLLPKFNDYSNNIINLNILPGLEGFNNELDNILLEELSYGSGNFFGYPQFQQWRPTDLFTNDENSEYTFLCFFQQVFDANLNFMIKKDALANMDFSIENVIGWSDNT